MFCSEITVNMKSVPPGRSSYISCKCGQFLSWFYRPIAFVPQYFVRFVDFIRFVCICSFEGISQVPLASIFFRKYDVAHGQVLSYYLYYIEIKVNQNAIKDLVKGTTKQNKHGEVVTLGTYFNLCHFTFFLPVARNCADVNASIRSRPSLPGYSDSQL